MTAENAKKGEKQAFAGSCLPADRADIGNSFCSTFQPSGNTAALNGRAKCNQAPLADEVRGDLVGD